MNQTKHAGAEQNMANTPTQTAPETITGLPPLSHRQILALDKHRLDGIFDTVIDGIITIDAEQKILFINPSAATMFGYTVEALLGTSLNQLIPQRHRQGHGKHVTQFGETGTTRRKMGVNFDDFYVTGLRADGTEFPIEASISNLVENGQKYFTVIFRGTFMPFAGIDVILDAAELLKDTDIQFHIVGRGALKEYVRTRIEHMRSRNIRSDLGFYTQEFITNAMRSAHVSLGQFSTEPRAQRTITSKTFESLCLGLPFITCDAQSTQELLDDGENCLYVPCGNPRALADAILSLKNNPELVIRMSENNRRLFERECTPSAIAARLVPVLENLIGCA